MDTFETLPDSQLTIFTHYSLPGQQMARGWSTNRNGCTWLRLTLDNKHLDDSIVATRESFVSFSFLNVYEFDLAIFRADVHEVVMQDRSYK